MAKTWTISPPDTSIFGKPSTTPLSYAGFFNILLLAQRVGIVSNVPGGLGVFETVMLVLISPPVAANDLFGALLAYRGVYYFLPLIIALLLLGRYELQQRFIPNPPNSP